MKKIKKRNPKSQLLFQNYSSQGTLECIDIVCIGLDWVSSFRMFLTVEIIVALISLLVMLSKNHEHYFLQLQYILMLDK